MLNLTTLSLRRIYNFSRIKSLFDSLKIVMIILVKIIFILKTVIPIGFKIFCHGTKFCCIIIDQFLK